MRHRGYNNVTNGTHCPYGFNGKEEQEELELNWIDYGWRNYDATLGRWMNLDPLAEFTRKYSPYSYALNNPVYYYDSGVLKEVKIIELVDQKEEVLMYNIKYVKKNNTFFANGILVHNRYIN